MRKKLSAVVFLCLILVLTFGGTAFAADDIETPATDHELVGELVGTSLDEPVEETIEETIEEELVPLDQNLTSELKEEEPIETEETDEPGDEGTADEPADEQIAEDVITDEEPVPETEAEDSVQPAFSYVVTVSDGTKSVDLTGGTSNKISDILSGLGYDIDGAEIVVDFESVDTDVISVTETEYGYVLNDNGPFSEAKRNLVVYINGEAVELTVVDPVEIGDKYNPESYKVYTSEELFKAFTSDAGDGHVRLVGNVRVSDGTSSFTLILETGNHDLYLNGYTLVLDNGSLDILGATLNVYGGIDKTSEEAAKEGVLKSVNNDDQGPLITVVSGCLNIFGGVISKDIGGGARVFEQGKINIYTGKVISNGVYGALFADKGIINVTGGMIEGDLKIDTNNIGKLRVAGGTFTKDPSSFLLKDNDTPCVNAVQTDSKWEVTPCNSYNSVRIGFDGMMSGYKSLQTAVEAAGTVVMLSDIINEHITVENDITLNLNGKVLDANLLCTNTYASAISVSENKTLVLIDTAPGNEHGNGLPKGGVITGGTGNVGTNTTGSETEAYFGGGVYVATGGKFTMNGGSISNNGGSTDTINLNYGGGVFVATNGTFRMNGGNISENTTLDSGGGIYNLGKIILSGGILTANNTKKPNVGGGVHCGTSSTTVEMIIGGDVNITGNKSQNTDSNVFLESGFTVKIATDELPKTGMTIGFTAADQPGENYAPIIISTECAASLSDIAISSDDQNYSVGKTTDGKLALFHVWVYHTSGNDINAKTKDLRFTKTISLTADDTAYSGSAYEALGTGDTDSEPFKNKYTVTYLKSGAVIEAPINVGDYTVLLTVNSTTPISKAFKITPKQLSVSNTSVKDSRVYDGTDLSEVTDTGTLSGLVDGDTVTLSATAKYDNKNIGAGKTVTVTYTIAGTDADNYTAPVPDNSKTADITARQLTVSGTTIESTRAYNGTNDSRVTAVGTLDNKVNGDDVTLSGTAKYDNKNVGTGKTVTVTYTITGTDTGNYSKPIDSGKTASITAKEVELVWTAPANLVYDNTSKVPTVVISNIVSSDTCAVTASLTDGKDNVNVGKFTFTATALDNSNYTLPATAVSDEYEITAKEIVVSGTVVDDKVYDGTTDINVSQIGTLVGVIDGDVVAVSKATATANSANAGTAIPVTVQFEITGEAALNYTVKSVTDLTVTITKATPGTTDFTVTLPETPVYNGTAKTAVVSSEKIGIGSITVKYYLGTTEVSKPVNAGTYTILLDVAAGENYEDATGISDNSWTFTISKANPTADDFTVTLPDNLVFDGTEKTVKVTPKHEGTGSITVKYYQNGKEVVSAKDAGTYDYKLFVSGGLNYNAGTVSSGSWTFTITVPPSGTVDLTVIELTSLTDTQIKAILNLLKEKEIKLVTILNVRNNLGRAGIIETIVIGPEYISGYNPSTLTIWILNDDNTMTLVPFRVVNGKIVIKNGKPGNYIITAP